MTTRTMIIGCLGLLAALCVGCSGGMFQMDEPLVVHEGSEDFGDIEELLNRSVDEQLAQLPKGNVMVFVEKVSTSSQSRVDASVAFRYANDDIVLSSPGGKIARNNGIRIGVGAGDFRAQFEADLRTTKSTGREEMFLTVLSGSEGSIRVGRETYFDRLGYWAPGGYTVLFEAEFLGADLVVRPRVLADGLIEVELYPRFTARGGRRAVDVTELATTVRVRDGQAIIVGSATTGRSEVGAALFGLSKQTQSGSKVVILTVRQGTQEPD